MDNPPTWTKAVGAVLGASDAKNSMNPEPPFQAVFLPDFMFRVQQRILLCSTIDKLAVGKGHMPTPENCQKLEIYSGYYHVAVNWGSSSIQEMTKEQKNNFKVKRVSAYLGAVRRHHHDI